MPRSYKNIQMYEKEILEMKSKGITKKAIGEQYGFSFTQVHNFITRYNANQRKIETGIALHKKGRPPKDCKIETDKVSELKYILARKEAKIKQLEMENELMRDFLSLTERK